MRTVSRASTVDSQLLDLNLNERTGNVYENKESRSRRVEELETQT
jgi:hypothetical protein